MPIKDSEGEVIGVAQAVNKVVNRNLAFNEHDEKVWTYVLFKQFIHFEMYKFHINSMTSVVYLVRLLHSYLHTYVH